MSKPSRAGLYDKIEKYLSKRIKVEHGCERAKATEDEVEAFENIIDDLLRLKYTESYDGIVPVEYTIVNRTTHERMSFIPIPYEDGEETLELAILNLQMASEAVRRANYGRQYKQGIRK